ncbi:MAG TPA: insulinase family protein [Candidatus Tidjanibacter gallistercoris]|nr:insulinase family protein [Candidatus Tidjanibacter gallistercoris]
MIKRIFLTVAATLAAVTGLFAQELPDDPEVRKGVLDNGMTYYIRHNSKPANQAEFWIFDNVGALQEEDSQQGLAHFLEHMAFNGTQNFPGKEMINYLESIGVKFGANLNAFTAQEMTCYNMSNVPITREGVIDSALLILHDWAYYITLDGDEIDNERGVIVEELRTRNSAGWRTNEKMRPFLYGDTRYTHRNIIGSEEGLRTFEHKELRDFYHRWYRTDMQAIMIVGDFDVDMMEQKVIALMSDIPAVENPEPKQEIVVAPNEEPVVGIITDPELTGTNVTLYIKRDPMPREYNKTADVALLDMLDQFMMTIADERLSDIAQKPDAPFVSAGMYSGYMVNAMDATLVQANARDGEALRAFDAMYTEVEKMIRFGFTQSEFDRAKTEIERQIQQEYDRRDDRRSDEFMWTFIYNYMLNAPMMSAQDEYELNNYLLQVINLDMLNQFVQQMRLTPTNQVVIVMAPEKEGTVIPTAEQIEETIAKVHAAELQADIEDFVIEPLIPAKTKLKGSKVTKTETDKFGATIWTLKNGAKVVVLPTDFKADEVTMQVISKGGKSVLADDEMLSADVLPNYTALAGLGKFNASDLRKQLTGKMASVSPFIGNYSNGFYASASPKDLETMLQLLYLSFTSPRFDESDFNVMMDKLEAAYLNMASNPMFQLQDTLTSTLYNHSPRRTMLTYDKLSEIDFAKLQEIYNKLYSNADDFTYTIVGNVDLDTLKPLVEKYIGSLPKTKQGYSWVDDGVRYPKGKVVNHFSTEMEMPKTSVLTIFTGEMPYTLENILAMDILSQILDIRYTATLREEKGGTYGVQTSGDASFAPVQTYMLFTIFDTDPAMADELKQDIVNEIQKLSEEGVKEEDLSKIKEYFAKQYPDQIKQNGYWLSTLVNYHLYGYDLDENYMETVNGFTSDYFKKLAAKILADGNVVEILMTPETAAE